MAEQESERLPVDWLVAKMEKWDSASLLVDMQFDTQGDDCIDMWFVDPFENKLFDMENHDTAMAGAYLSLHEAYGGTWAHLSHYCMSEDGTDHHMTRRVRIARVAGEVFAEYKIPDEELRNEINNFVMRARAAYHTNLLTWINSKADQ